MTGSDLFSHSTALFRDFLKEIYYMSKEAYYMSKEAYYMSKEDYSTVTFDLLFVFRDFLKEMYYMSTTCQKRPTVTLACLNT
jgi:hypothetical protein